MAVGYAAEEERPRAQYTGVARGMKNYVDRESPHKSPHWERPPLLVPIQTFEKDASVLFIETSGSSCRRFTLVELHELHTWLDSHRFSVL